MKRIGEGFLKRRELRGFLACDGLAGKGGMEDHIGENLEDGQDVGGKAAGLDEQGIVTRRGGDGCAERLERVGDLVGIAGGGAFWKSGGKQLVEAVVLRFFRRQARAGGGLEMDQRHAAIWQEREAEAVGKGVGGDRVGNRGSFALRGGGDIIFRID